MSEKTANQKRKEAIEAGKTKPEKEEEKPKTS